MACTLQHNREVKTIQLRREQIAGLRPADMQSYEAYFTEEGIIPVDCESIPHRKLTYCEAAQVFTVFYEVGEHFREEYESVFDRLSELRRRINEDDQLSRELRDAIDAAINLYWDFGRAMGFMAYLAGQREGFRLGAAAVTRAANDPNLAAAVMGALVDDKQLDRLIGQLATGREEPEYVG